jgi:exodeoxyribonuclease-3
MPEGAGRARASPASLRFVAAVRRKRSNPDMSTPLPKSLRILSWNVNGLRSCAGKGFFEFLAGSGADVLGIQESRVHESDLPDAHRRPPGFHSHFVSAERKGYSGVALFSKLEPSRLEGSLGVPEFDTEGRYQLMELGELWIVNGYFPNGSGKERDNSRIPFKLDFYRKVFDRLEAERRAGRPILVMGDFNTAHREIDLARPQANRKTSGFCPEECAELDRWLEAGWCDTFRRYEPGPGHYSWWSQRFGVREKNIGWRIDYVLASPGALPFLEKALLLPEVRGSDHCPVGVEIASAALGSAPPARPRRTARK